MSDYLFARPSFLTGMGRALDLGGVFDAYNDSPTEEDADARALRADWVAVGGDIKNAVRSTAPAKQ
jgi:hypothetical protein